MVNAAWRIAATAVATVHAVAPLRTRSAHGIDLIAGSAAQRATFAPGEE